MLKKIAAADLRVGMFVHQLCSAWLDSPFWRQSFLIQAEQERQKIRESGIQQVIIDTSRGLDVEQEMEREVSMPSVPEQPAPASVRNAPIPTRAVMKDEMERAARIVEQSRKAVASMFSEARLGKVIQGGSAAPIVEEISASVMRHPGALISIARLKSADDYTFMHSVAVCALMVALARQLKLNDRQTREAGMAGLLHDIGKMSTPKEVLTKPGKLTDAEFSVIRNHPRAGHDMLSAGKGIGEATLDVCLHHHEKMDGTGYPNGLAGEQISLYARMGAVCDVYDAITSNRPYKRGWDPAESLRKMAEWTKGHLDPVIFQAFVKSVGIYPPGSLVRLESGRVGVVVECPEGKPLLQPLVRVFFSTKFMAYITPELVDLSHSGSLDKIVSIENAGRLGLKDIDHFWSSSPVTG